MLLKEPDSQTYLDFYRKRFVSKRRRAAWLDASVELLSQDEQSRAPLAAWSGEARCALCASSYYLWTRHLPDLSGKKARKWFEAVSSVSKEMRDFSQQIEKDRRAEPNRDYENLYRAKSAEVLASQTGMGTAEAASMIAQVEADILLARRASELAVLPPAYDRFQDSLLQAVRENVDGDARFDRLHENWPAVMKRAARGEETLLHDFLEASVDGMVGKAKALYIECFKDLPKIKMTLAADLPPCFSGQYFYSAPGRKKGCSFRFSLADDWSCRSVSSLLVSFVHEAEHLLQCHLGWKLDRKDIPSWHPLLESAQAFNTLTRRDWAHGARTIYCSSYLFMAGVWEAYLAAPRERAAHRLSRALGASLAQRTGGTDPK